MESETPHRLSNFYAGAVILLAMLIGGATLQGVWTDHVLEIALLPALLVGLYNFPDNRLAPFARLLILVSLVFVCLQFLPFERPWPHMDSPLDARTTFLTPAPLRSLESILFFVPLVGFTLYAATLSDQQHERLVRFVFLGLWLNVAIGLMQLSFAGRLRIDHILPYSLDAGIFANENHYSALIFSMIPLLAWRYLAKTGRPFVYLMLVGVLIIVLFATGSRAGMALSICVSIFALAWYSARRTAPLVRLCFILPILIGLAAGVNYFTPVSSLDGDYRLVIYDNTWSAITDYWQLGSGLGTFPLVYPMYEEADDIFNRYVARAHNDYLQIFLELGIVGLSLLLTAFVLFAAKFGRSELSQSAMLSVMMIALHSLVDYPMRTMGIAVPIALLVGILLVERENYAPPKDESL